MFIRLFEWINSVNNFVATIGFMETNAIVKLFISTPIWEAIGISSQSLLFSTYLNDKYY